MVSVQFELQFSKQPDFSKNFLEETLQLVKQPGPEDDATRSLNLHN